MEREVGEGRGVEGKMHDSFLPRAIWHSHRRCNLFYNNEETARSFV